MNATTTPRLIGVLDLMDGVAVRAIGGRRDEYRPLRSQLCDSPDPRRIAAAYRDRYGITDLYIADLDAIRGKATNATAPASSFSGAVVTALAGDGFTLSVDAGLRNSEDAISLIDAGAATVIAGLETIDSPAVLQELVERFGSDRVVFSLDLAGGVPLADPSRWNQPTWTADSPLQIAQQAADAGIRKLIVLDLHAVGTGDGPVTRRLCREIHTSLPDVTLWTGGGVRSLEDVSRLAEAGAAGVLVASVLHDLCLAATVRERVERRAP